MEALKYMVGLMVRGLTESTANLKLFPSGLTKKYLNENRIIRHL